MQLVKIRCIALIITGVLVVSLTVMSGCHIVISQSSTYNTSVNSSKSLVGTFYYPWYGGKDEGYKKWNGYGHDPPRTWDSNYLPSIEPAKFDPSNELYDSNNPSIIKKQIGWMRQAGIQFVISSWWGQNSYTDHAFSNIIKNVMSSEDNPFPSLKWVLLYEQEGYNNTTISRIISDLYYIKTEYASSQYYLKIDGKPVIFVFNADHNGYDQLQALAKWKNAGIRTGFHVVMKVDPLKKGADPSSINGWYQYDPTKTYDQQLWYSASVSPGYWKFHKSPVLARNITAFERSVQRLAKANVYFKLIETWNEWPEGTGVEPAQRIIHDDITGFRPAAPSYDNIYLEILGKYLR
jgi:glycosyl hydrolase family 99